MLDGLIKHHSFSRMLKVGSYENKNIWLKGKGILKTYKDKSKVLSIDNTISPKSDSKVNEVVNWFYDHSVGRAVKGIKLISALIHVGDANIPVGFEVQTKENFVVEKDKAGRERLKRKACYTINELARKLVLKLGASPLNCVNSFTDKPAIYLQSE
ncbi:hypothetical protein E4K63_00290 [Allofrancisella inopinata]|uniref:Uncharacterized protein n=1 Tax=Allofrancisella inopinata TaxID=1085647 RepID=A0AAE7CQH2_9GAMM|nr:hypothetical protein [Allofrancisella inopinata]QIV95354.1 hypothetical protein E4K63_00290 [Allofrancisella inopinata]